jgi:hypothetical protein
MSAVFTFNLAEPLEGLEVGSGIVYSGASDPSFEQPFTVAQINSPTQFVCNGNPPLSDESFGGTVSTKIPIPATGVGTQLYLNDESNTVTFLIAITTSGVLQPVQVAYNPNAPQALSFVSVQGDQRWSLQVKNLGNGLGVLQTFPIGIVGRGPLVTLRWSNDGGHTWSNGYDRDCGQAGDYRRRVLWNRLGRSRDRVYEISMSDPVPWRIVDAYLFTDPDDKEPTSRYSSELRKRA